MAITPELVQEAERRAAEFLHEQGLRAEPGQARSVFLTADGFEMTAEDRAELKQPSLAVAHFLIGGDGLIRWSRDDQWMVPLPPVEELHRLV